MAGAKCSYPSCLGVYLPNLLEICQTSGCNGKLHHLCQTEFEHGQNIDVGLSKKCMTCLAAVISTKLLKMGVGAGNSDLGGNGGYQ